MQSFSSFLYQKNVESRRKRLAALGEQYTKDLFVKMVGIQQSAIQIEKERALRHCRQSRAAGRPEAPPFSITQLALVLMPPSGKK